MALPPWRIGSAAAALALVTTSVVALGGCSDDGGGSTTTSTTQAPIVTMVPVSPQSTEAPTTQAGSGSGTPAPG